MKSITYISAGAGSGKTTRIIAELVNAIKGGIRPSEIIMTTFTRAAAQEMRERAKAELLKQGMNDKANEMGAATIGTIHSVCLRFLQKYWYLVGLSPEIQEMDENDFNTYVDRSLFLHVSESNIQQFEQWRKVLDLKKHDGSATKPYAYWREWLRKMANIVRYYHIDDLKQSREKSIEEINAVFDRNAFNQDEYDRCKQEYIDAISGNGRLKKRLDYILNYDPITEKGKISIAEGKDNYADMHNAWALAAGKAAFSDSKRQAAIAIVEKLFDILTHWRSEYQAYKLSHKMLDYNDMEVYFYLLLKQDDVKAELARYRLVLVDEFQDCNPMQVDIFSRISDMVPRSIWVGDPKQAIYGFRGTDTTLVKEVSDKIVDGKDGCHRDTIDTNYRSRPELVQYVNNTFLPVFSKEPFCLSEEEIRLKEIRKCSLDFEPHCEWVVSKQRNSTDLSAIAHNIRTIVEEQQTYVEPKGQPKRLVRYGDIAILVRKNATIAKFSEVLRKFGIPFFAPQDNDKNNQPIEIRLLMELAQYKYSWKYRPHLRADIVHLLKNTPTQDLLQDYFNHLSVRLDEEGKRCYDGKIEWMIDDELIQCIEKIMQDCYAMNLHDTLTTLVDRLNLYDLVAMWGDTEIRRSNISRVLQLAKSFDRHCDILEIEKPTYADYAKYMDDANAKDELNLDSPSVKIITMHKSKGLEWPIVIYYDLDNDFTKDEKILDHEFFGIREQRLPDHSYWLRVFPALSGSTLPQLYQESYFRDSKQRVEADETRLRYVSLTRARDMLVTVRAEKDGPAYVHEPETKNYPLIDTTQTQQHGSDLPYHINPSKSGITSTLMPSPATEVSRIPIPEQNEDVRMSSIGTCIHNIYAAYDASMDEHTSTQMAQRIIDSVRLSQILNANEVIVVIRSLYDHLTKQYGAPTSVGHEVPFSYVRNNGQLLRGEIDLLWHTSDGVVLVDYKNIQGDEANPEHYAAQMEAYREVIRAAKFNCKAIVLFYATLGKIIELV